MRSTLLPILCCRFWQQIGNNVNSTAVAVDFVTDTVDLVASVYGAKATRRLCRLSTKSTVLNSTVSPVCTAIALPVLRR